jgi:hypothetical protein
VFLDRNVFQIKKGCYDAAVALTKEEIALAAKDGFSARLLMPVFGTFDQMVMEYEYEDKAKNDAFWAKWVEERGAIFTAKFDPLNTGVGSNEVWNVVDPVPHDPKCRLVNRREFQVVPGGMPAVADLIIAGREENPINVYFSDKGMMNRVAMELEFENFTAYDAAWEAVGEKYFTPEFWAKWNSLTLPGGVNEIWQVL